MIIKEVSRYSQRVFLAASKLLSQLDPDSDMITEERLKSILRSGHTHFFIAETENKKIAGMLSAVVYFIPTGIKFWIEDVVVDEDYRGKGIGKELMMHAMEYAKSTGAKSIDLTSRPSRVAANTLYRELGFVLRETNVYRYTLK
jgi:ribosomal protein S18 acetylase RimI-like enzyme